MTKEIPPHDANARDTNNTATDAGNFSIILKTKSEIIGTGN